MCADDISDEITYTTEVMDKTSLIVEHLEPYSEYFFNVTAKAETFSGQNRNVTCSTSATDTLQQEEVPINLDVKHDAAADFPQIIWTEPPCSKIRGPIKYGITLRCTNEWCEEPVKLNLDFQNKYDEEKVFQYNVQNLIPYSDYLVNFVTSRSIDHDNKGIQFDKEFKTKEKEPLRVRNLTVYSQNENGISLRWKPPYPPRGYLENYVIQCFGNHACKSKKVVPKQCNVWEDFHCGELSELEENTLYNIQVKAKNVGVDTRGEREYIRSIYTRQSASEPPLNVNVMWNQDIPSLQWDHPDITNGPLKFFNIEINVIDSEILNRTKFHEKFNIETYKKTYSYEMNILNYSTIYEIKVHGVNKFQGKPSENVTVKMPPPTPEFPVVPSIHCSDLICKLKISKPMNVGRSSYLYVIVDSNKLPLQTQNINITKRLTDTAIKGDEQKSSWQAVALPISNHAQDFITITLGNGTKTTTERYGDAFNKPLQNDTNYIITVILENSYMGETRSNQQVVHVFIEESSNGTNTTALYGLLALLIIPIAIGGWILYRKYSGNNQISMNKSYLPVCCKRSTSDIEQLSLESPKPMAVVKPKCFKATDTTPLLSESEENIQFSCRVPLERFEEYVKESIGTNDENGELVRQHSLFVRGQTKPWEYGMLKQNKYKNRYNNLIAYDHTRVKLEKMNNDDFSDYINANYVDGYKKPKAYIATQGPKPTTVHDFWRMVWQERVTTIVMVANVEEDGKKKTEQYWPKLNTSQRYGLIEVYHNNSDIFSNYTFRTLTITKDNEQHTIEQLHFTSWPDHGVPLYPQSLVPFVKRLLTTPQDSVPIIVHCSAGVGRTGTIILCDFVLRMAAGEGAVDFLATLKQMRDQRANLVDNPSQYKLAHLVVLEALFGLETTIPCDDRLEQKVQELLNSDGLYKQMDYLEKITWQDHAMRTTFTSTLNSANNNKNRFSSIIPDGFGRVYLSRYPVADEHSDYINAIEVDGFNTSKQFIVTQQPLPHTVSDFWRMVHEKEAATIVSLTEITPQDESSCVFWPEENEVLDLQFIKVSYVDKEEHSSHNVIKVLLMYETEENDESRRNVNIVQMKGWPPLKTIPNSLESLMAVWEEVAKLARGNNPTIVTCYDGAKACGVYVALSFVIEKIKLEHICDVCLAVRTIRHNRKQFVTNVEQFELLYKAAVQYLQGFATYSNFPISNKQQNSSDEQA